jgi:hypothetical protein
VDEDQIDLGRQVGDTKNMDEVVYMAVQVKDKQYFDKFRGQIKTFKDWERQVIPPVWVLTVSVNLILNWNSSFNLNRAKIKLHEVKMMWLAELSH